jgi:hypothetical protein
MAAESHLVQSGRFDMFIWPNLQMTWKFSKVTFFRYILYFREGGRSGDQVIDGRITLQNVFGTEVVNMESSWSKLRIGSSFGLLWRR